MASFQPLLLDEVRAMAEQELNQTARLLQISLLQTRRSGELLLCDLATPRILRSKHDKKSVWACLTVMHRFGLDEGFSVLGFHTVGANAGETRKVGPRHNFATNDLVILEYVPNTGATTKVGLPIEPVRLFGLVDLQQIAAAWALRIDKSDYTFAGDTPSSDSIVSITLLTDNRSSRFMSEPNIHDTHGVWIAVKVCSLTTSLREFQALHCLQHTEFHALLLSPPSAATLYPGYELSSSRAPAAVGSSDMLDDVAPTHTVSVLEPRAEDVARPLNMTPRLYDVLCREYNLSQLAAIIGTLNRQQHPPLGASAPSTAASPPRCDVELIQVCCANTVNVFNVPKHQYSCIVSVLLHVVS